MSGFNPVVKGRLVGLAVFIGLILAYVGGRNLVALTADDSRGDYLLWIHDRDAYPGGTIAVRLRDDEILHTRLGGATSDFLGAHRYYRGDDSDTVDFDVDVPATAEPGNDYTLTIDDRFERTVHVHSKTTALLRRAARGAGAIAIWLVVALLLVRATRFYARLQWGVSALLYLLAIPHIALGYVAFGSLLAAALGVHAVGFHIGALVVWSVLLVVPGRVALHRGLPCYHAVSALVATGSEHDAYRTARVQEVIEPLATMEEAWSAAGLLVQRRRGELVLTKQREGYAIVPVARSETFGDQPLEVFTRQRAMATQILQAAANVLGPLRASVPGEVGELVFEKQTPGAKPS